MSGDDVSTWHLSPHICRTCLGRVLVADDLFRCSTCGARAEWTPHAICGCGIKPRADGTRFFCAENPNRQAIPAEVVIAWAMPTPPELIEEPSR